MGMTAAASNLSLSAAHRSSDQLSDDGVKATPSTLLSSPTVSEARSTRASGDGTGAGARTTAPHQCWRCTGASEPHQGTVQCAVQSSARAWSDRLAAITLMRYGHRATRLERNALAHHVPIPGRLERRQSRSHFLSVWYL